MGTHKAGLERRVLRADRSLTPSEANSELIFAPALSLWLNGVGVRRLHQTLLYRPPLAHVGHRWRLNREQIMHHRCRRAHIGNQLSAADIPYHWQSFQIRQSFIL